MLVKFYFRVMLSFLLTLLQEENFPLGFPLQLIKELSSLILHFKPTNFSQAPPQKSEGQMQVL